MVKLVEKKGKVKSVKYVYDNQDIAEANYLGMFSPEGDPVTDREIKGEKKPDEYLWAEGPKGRANTPDASRTVESVPITVKIKNEDGKVEKKAAFYFKYA